MSAPNYLHRHLHRLSLAINARDDELRPALCGFLLFLCLFAGYFMLRPIRESMGITAGVENLQWLFTATFLVMLAAVPLFAWLSARVPRLRLIDWVYGFFGINLLLFVEFFQFAPDSVWLARVFYVWISVYNLFVVSVAWSLMADVFDSGQAKRLFAFIAAGASIGGLLGPALSAALIGLVGASGLMLIAALLLGATLVLKRTLMRWRETGGAGRPGAAPTQSPRQPLGGNPFSGLSAVLRSPYLLGIAGFVVLLATVSTFLYFEQARLVNEHFPDREAQVRVFGTIDIIVQAGALVSQLFISGRIAPRLGVRTLLAVVPLIMCVGFLGLALAPGFALLATLMIVRRIGEYAFVRPGREMLFAPLDAESKYKAKNFIDTVVYRGGDAVSGWAKSLLDMLGQGAALVAVIGAACALLWGYLGWQLGRQADDWQETAPVGMSAVET
ncbi:ATP:ADP antiporter, AAA family [Pseudomonas sp. NFACC09-4]|uniref:NTP/NDP exchange transporter n=1 Tax=Pseudomonas TaxID=286 RepID=UPI0009090C17|nr:MULTISPECIES: MFS transporter [Pseudomonas]NHN68683.1 MFS transporter [Pseudomonas fluorescens]ROO38022.1 ADP/ATP translocating protein [Pseudomonas sp. AF76]SFW67058.1 ATP:ADP antiporter, AAA family [Pseudomonas sp. NFACC09-4]